MSQLSSPSLVCCCVSTTRQEAHLLLGKLLGSAATPGARQHDMQQSSNHGESQTQAENADDFYRNSPAGLPPTRNTPSRVLVHVNDAAMVTSTLILGCLFNMLGARPQVPTYSNMGSLHAGHPAVHVNHRSYSTQIQNGVDRAADRPLGGTTDMLRDSAGDGDAHGLGGGSASGHQGNSWGGNGGGGHWQGFGANDEGDNGGFKGGNRTWLYLLAAAAAAALACLGSTVGVQQPGTCSVPPGGQVSADGDDEDSNPNREAKLNHEELFTDPILYNSEDGALPGPVTGGSAYLRRLDTTGVSVEGRRHWVADPQSPCRTPVSHCWPQPSDYVPVFAPVGYAPAYQPTGPLPWLTVGFVALPWWLSVERNGNIIQTAMPSGMLPVQNGMWPPSSPHGVQQGDEMRDVREWSGPHAPEEMLYENGLLPAEMQRSAGVYSNVIKKSIAEPSMRNDSDHASENAIDRACDTATVHPRHPYRPSLERRVSQKGSGRGPAPRRRTSNADHSTGGGSSSTMIGGNCSSMPPSDRWTSYGGSSACAPTDRWTSCGCSDRWTSYGGSEISAFAEHAMRGNSRGGIPSEYWPSFGGGLEEHWPGQDWATNNGTPPAANGWGADSRGGAPSWVSAPDSGRHHGAHPRYNMCGDAFGGGPSHPYSSQGGHVSSAQPERAQSRGAQQRWSSDGTSHNGSQACYDRQYTASCGGAAAPVGRNVICRESNGGAPSVPSHQRRRQDNIPYNTSAGVGSRDALKAVLTKGYSNSGASGINSASSLSPSVADRNNYDETASVGSGSPTVSGCGSDVPIGRYALESPLSKASNNRKGFSTPRGLPSLLPSPLTSAECSMSTRSNGGSGESSPIADPAERVAAPRLPSLAGEESDGCSSADVASSDDDAAQAARTSSTPVSLPSQPPTSTDGQQDVKEESADIPKESASSSSLAGLGAAAAEDGQQLMPAVVDADDVLSMEVPPSYAPSVMEAAAQEAPVPAPKEEASAEEAGVPSQGAGTHGDGSSSGVALRRHTSGVSSDSEAASRRHSCDGGMSVPPSRSESYRSHRSSGSSIPADYAKLYGSNMFAVLAEPSMASDRSSGSTSPAHAAPCDGRPSASLSGRSSSDGSALAEASVEHTAAFNVSDSLLSGREAELDVTADVGSLALAAALVPVAVPRLPSLAGEESDGCSSADVASCDDDAAQAARTSSTPVSLPSQPPTSTDGQQDVKEESADIPKGSASSSSLAGLGAAAAEDGQQLMPAVVDADDVLSMEVPPSSAPPVMEAAAQEAPMPAPKEEASAEEAGVLSQGTGPHGDSSSSDSSSGVALWRHTSGVGSDSGAASRNQASYCSSMGSDKSLENSDVDEDTDDRLAGYSAMLAGFRGCLVSEIEALQRVLCGLSASHAEAEG